jgi:integrase
VISGLTLSEVGSSESSVEDERLLVREYLEAWLQRCEVRGLRPGTVRSYRFNMSLYVLPYIGNLALGALTAQRLNGLYRTLLRSGRRGGERGVGARSVRYAHTILNRALADAVKLGLVERNVAVAADPPSARAARAAPRPTWTAEELRSFLAAAKGDPFYAAYYLAAATGVRRSELLGACWKDIDLTRREMRVVQTLIVLGRELQTGLPKSDRGRRAIALDEQTVAVLTEHRSVQEDRAWAIGRTLARSDRVFSKPDGSPIHPAVFAYHFQRGVARSGLPKIAVHDLRHTHATLALQLGIHPKIVSERLGHASVMITLDTYSHALPSLQREAAEAFGGLLQVRDSSRAHWGRATGVLSGRK